MDKGSNVDMGIRVDVDKISNSESGFKYPIIDPTSQVRLLRILPLSRREPMEFSLETFNLSDLPSTNYTALSYTWGDATRLDQTREIIIDDQPFVVRRNLYWFFDVATGKNANGLYFIDAICINQSDNTERFSQVREIAQVYRNADQVVAWLGMPKSLGKFEHLRSLRRIQFKSCAEWTAGEWEGFRYLSYHSYWTRVWVVQEVLLARSMSVWCAWFDFPLALFAGVPSHTIRSSRTGFSASGRPQRITDPVSDSRSPAEKIITHRTRQVLRPIKDPLAQGTAAGTLSEITRALRRPYMVGKTYQSQVPDLLHEVIQKFGKHDCSDRRDKLYGFLGIIKQSSRAKVNPDYTKDVSYAYRQALRVGFEEICDEFWAAPSPRAGVEMYRTCLAYYCDARDAFGMGDAESMAILQDVVDEIDIATRHMDPIDEYGWRQGFSRDGIDPRIFASIEKLLRIAGGFPRQSIGIRKDRFKPLRGAEFG